MLHKYPKVYLNYDLEIKFLVNKDNMLQEVAIQILDQPVNKIHAYKLIQKTPTQTQLLDNSNHVLSEFNFILSSEDPPETIVKIICELLKENIIKEKKETKEQKQEEIQCNSRITEFHPLANNPKATISYTPQQIRTAYNVPNPKINASISPVITIIIAYTYPKLQSDFNRFCQEFNLPTKPLIISSLTRQQNSVWALEECLDVQWAYAMNPNATIQVVEAKSSSVKDIFDAITYASNPPQGANVKYPDIISMSLGANEFNGCAQVDATFRQRSNICYFAASGDTNPVCYPSSSPNVVACGGTTLYLNPQNNSRIGETTWQSAGCGVSKYFPKPNYQTSNQNLIKYNNRCTTDIAAVANQSTGVLVCYNNNFFVVGGTSVSTPICAGIFSLAIGQRKYLRKPALTTNANSNSKTLLQNFIYQNRQTCFYDVAQGKDGIYQSTSGYDIPTGNGVPNGKNLINALVNY